jgi:L-asparaginase
MIKNPETGSLSSVDFTHVYDHIPELKRVNAEVSSASVKKPIDSSEMSIANWQEIATIISENYTEFDGFVVLHGSDTMAYTASALSFMLEGLNKPVILTGSQLPIGVIRTDGKENIITAIEIAAEKRINKTPLIQEVAVYFDYTLFRGNRCTKDSAENFEAFRSPNLRPLAIAGVRLNYNEEIFWQPEVSDLVLRKEMSNEVLLVKLFPGMRFDFLSKIIETEHFRGLVIESFGAGNGPQNETFASALKTFNDRGGVILNITQCSSGSVSAGMYESSNIFNEAGVVSGGDMTTEAAVTKLMFLIANAPIGDVKELLRKSIRGEITH